MAINRAHVAIMEKQLKLLQDKRSMDYSLRGKCKEMSEELVKNDPSLTLVRGWYICSSWGEQQHWWTKDKDGKIIDPTAEQFPSMGRCVYVEFDGFSSCEFCGKETHEDNAYTYGHHFYCSSECFGKDVGLI